jgi:preprotein translocase subunit SecE
MSEAAGNKLDSLKWVLVALLVGAGIYGNSYFSDESLLYRVIGTIGGCRSRVGRSGNDGSW